MRTLVCDLEGSDSMPRALAKLLNADFGDVITDHVLIRKMADSSFESSLCKSCRDLRGHLGIISAIVEMSWRIGKGLP